VCVRESKREIERKEKKERERESGRLTEFEGDRERIRDLS